jgi:hypothetical protein
MSNPSDRVPGTPPTNTTISQSPDATSRRRFLTKAAGIAAGGTVLTLAPIPPTPALAAPASLLDGVKASPALRAAGRALRDAHERLKKARAAFDATETLLEEWQRLNPKPIGRRAVKRWERREHEYRYSVTMPPWEAVNATEDDFLEAQKAVAKIDARDMSELAFKACLSCVYDAVHLSSGRTAAIGFSVALNLASLAVRS